MDYQNWKHGEDELVLDRLSVFEMGQPATDQEAEKDFCVQTERGSFYQIKRKEDEIYDLFFFDGDLESMILGDCCVLATNRKEQFLLVYEKVSGYVYLIDTRGILFLYSTLPFGLRFQPGEYELKYNKENCCYDIDLKDYGLWSVKISSHNLSLFEFHTEIEDEELEINPDFKDFFEKEDKELYLYLTYNGLKMKKVVSFLIENGVPFEEVPNLFKGDDFTRNIRILLNEENLEMEQVQFLIARYDNCYSIFEMPYQTYVGNMDVDVMMRKEFMREHVSKGSPKQSKKIQAILKSMRVITDCRLDSILFNEYFKKIAEKMQPDLRTKTDNLFCKLIVPSPKSHFTKEENKQILLENVEYIKQLKLPYTQEGIEGMNAKEAYKACVAVHIASMKNFRKQVRDYEEGVAINKRLYGRTGFKTRENAIWNYLFYGEDIT